MKCCKCKETIIGGRAFPFYRGKICMGCAVEYQLAQNMDVEVNHILNCSNLYCVVCELGFCNAMRKLGYKQTEKGDWYKLTENRKIVRIYDDLLTNLPTYSVSKKECKL